MIGKNGNQSVTQWTPQSCKKTTPAPTTTTTAAPTTTTMGDEEKAQAAEDNINLKQELQDLKQQYNAIGETMYEVVKDNVYHEFEAYLARKKESVYLISLISLMISHVCMKRLWRLERLVIVGPRDQLG